jgi:hypothetical protein
LDVTKANPYLDLPSSAFWRSGVAEDSPFSPADLYGKKFDILADDKIATAGSCFAQNIGRFLTRNGYSVIDAEPPPQWLTAEQRAAYGYRVYSARYGNIYSVAQLAQLAAECTGAFEPQDIAWRRGDLFIDGQRPGVEPDGFDSVEDLLLARRYHLQQVRSVFQSMDVFVFTLGLTETWRHVASGTIFPIAPGVMGGIYDGSAYEFINLNYTQVAETFLGFLKTLAKLRGGRMPKILLTVSPVPLTATASGRHVLAANAYSKSVLRAVAGDLSEVNDFIAYFPSYEIVTNPAARGAFFDANLRTVRDAGVQAVMDAFFRNHPPLSNDGDTARSDAALKAADQEAAVQCEEALLAAFGQ